MNRSRKILIVCHCVLNSNAKVLPLATCEGVYHNVIEEYTKKGFGLLQLPCPETGYLGLNRWGMTREQYNHHNFRSYCHEILQPTLHQIKAFNVAGYEIAGVIGMDGSPNCGVDTTCSGFSGGEVCSQFLEEQTNRLSMISGTGVFMEVFQQMLSNEGISLEFWGVEEKQINEIKEKN